MCETKKKKNPKHKIGYINKNALRDVPLDLISPARLKQ